MDRAILLLGTVSVYQPACCPSQRRNEEKGETAVGTFVIIPDICASLWRRVRGSAIVCSRDPLRLCDKGSHDCKV